LAESRVLPSKPERPTEQTIERRPARILVCDDDQDVRSVVGSLLRDLGHLVWDVSDPLRALQVLERECPVDLLLADYAMPKMNGRVLIERARLVQPGLKTLLMTGYAEALRKNGAPGIPVLPKPFKTAELSDRIAEILADPSSGVTAESRSTIH
jgi:CheY-like chemotaxis protein